MNFRLWLETNEIIMPELFERVKQLKDEYSGVHFSNMDQLSFNLKPSHHDPIGLYVFPKNYILSGGLKSNSMFSSFPYAFLIEPTNNSKVLNLDMSYEEAEKLLNKIGLDKNLLYDKEVYHNSGSSPGHKFWGVLENIRNSKNLSRNISWNSFFSKTGFNTLYDPGLGIIHSNEPMQVVYLDHKAYKIVDVIKSKNNNIFAQFASAFPDFQIFKRKSHLDSKYKENYLKKDGITIHTVLTEYKPDELRIKVYGFMQDFEDKFSIENKEDLTKAVEKVREFINGSEKAPPRFTDEDYSFVKELSSFYNIKVHPDYPGYLGKKYKDNTEFSLKYSPTNSKITLQVERRDFWVKYFYYYEVLTSSPEETIKSLLSGIKERIKEDMVDEDSRKKYDAPHALKFVEFLEKRVFVRRR